MSENQTFIQNISGKLEKIEPEKEYFVLTEEELRLACLKLSVRRSLGFSTPVDVIIENAKKFEDYIRPQG